MPSIIGADLIFEGNLQSAGDITIQGAVKGDVDGKSVIVDREGLVSGSIHAHALIISGSVDGQIEATSVTLRSTAKVTGDLLHRSLTVEAGASLEAQLHQMTQDRKAPAAKAVKREKVSVGSARQPSAVSAPATTFVR